MKIPNYINLKINDAYLNQSRPMQNKDKRDIRSASESRKPKKDEIVLSSRAAEVRKFEGLVRDVPEVRQEKIEAIKSQIESKTYTVDGRLVAKSVADFLI